MFFLQIFMDIFYFTHLYTSLQPPVPPRLCKNCKFFLPNDPWFGVGNEFSKCALFPIVKEDDSYFLVTGKQWHKKKEYHYCSISRKYEDMCGKEGKYYKRKRNPDEE